VQDAQKALEAGPDLPSQRHHKLGANVEQKHAHAGCDCSAVGEEFLRFVHGGIVADQAVLSEPEGRAIAASFTGKFTSAAKTPSAIETYHTMS
jgi:hypothetical protein